MLRVLLDQLVGEVEELRVLIQPRHRANVHLARMGQSGGPIGGLQAWAGAGRAERLIPAVKGGSGSRR